MSKRTKITDAQAKRKRMVLEQFFANALDANYHIKLQGLRGTYGTAVDLSEIVDDGFKIISKADFKHYDWHILNLYDADHILLGFIIITNGETNLSFPPDNELIRSFVEKTMNTPYSVVFDPSLPYGPQLRNG